MWLAVSLLALSALRCPVLSAGAAEVIFAVNCGGEAFTDSAGVHYEADPLAAAGEAAGTASDYGRQLEIARVPTADRPLYQTERYHHRTFGYDLPPLSDGSYVLVLKFSEVYFNAPDQKVFDVVFNGEHTVVQELDIFALVGRGVAHDELVPFTVHAGHVTYRDETSDIEASGVRVDFVKGHRDNPKVNAIVLLKGTLQDAPRLPELSSLLADEQRSTKQSDYDFIDHDLDPDQEDNEAAAAARTDRQRRTSTDGGGDDDSRRAPPSGPMARDPYDSEETGAPAMLPVFITIGACVPLLLCLCKL